MARLKFYKSPEAELHEFGFLKKGWGKLEASIVDLKKKSNTRINSLFKSMVWNIELRISQNFLKLPSMK